MCTISIIYIIEMWNVMTLYHVIVCPILSQNKHTYIHTYIHARATVKQIEHFIHLNYTN